jgi:hypothetical protein
MAKNLTISAYDPSNPQYWEQHGGKGKPVDQDWYDNKKDGFRRPRDWAKEDFLAGFRICPGEYYKLRSNIIPLVVEQSLQYSPSEAAKLDPPIHIKALDDFHSKWIVSDIAEKIKQSQWYKKPHLNDIPAPWKQQWLEMFIKEGVIGWMRKHKAVFQNQQDLDTLIAPDGKLSRSEEAAELIKRPTTWKFDEKTRRSPPKFNGIWQVQHLFVDVTGHDDASKHAFPARQIRKDTTVPITADDTAIGDFCFSKLEELLQGDESEVHYDPSLHTICCSLPGIAAPFRIHNDRTLQMALRGLRQYRQPTVRMNVVERDQVCHSFYPFRIILTSGRATLS